MTKLNLGGGADWYMMGWECLDISNGYDLSVLNLSKYADSSVDVIYTSHCIEHLTLPQVIALLGDCYRVLRKDGLIRIVVPDLDIYSYIQLNDQRQILEEGNPHYYARPEHKRTPLSEHVKFLLGWGSFVGSESDHKSFFTLNSLSLFLSLLGFKKITRVSFCDSDLKELRKEAVLNLGGMPVTGFDNANTRNISLYVEAMKIDS